MTLSRRTVVDQVEVMPTGAVGVRIRKEIVDGDDVISSGYHRTAVASGQDAQAQMDLCNEHLQLMGCEPVAQAEIDLIVACCATVTAFRGEGA